MNRPRAADDFAAIRARMEELSRQREEVKPSDNDNQRSQPIQLRGSIRWPPSESIAGPGRVRHPVRS